MSEHIELEINDSRAVITISRPERRNALSYAMFYALENAFAQADADDSVRSIILTGVNDNFCAGTDLTELRPVGHDETPTDREELSERRSWFVHNTRKPVIAAIDGPTAGLGVELATQADIRIGTSRSRYSWIFVKRGLIPDTGAGTWLLPRIIGQQQALRLVMSASFINAEEALNIGYLLDVVEPENLLPKAFEIADSFAVGSPFAIERAKRLIQGASSRSLTEHLASHAVAVTECQRSEDHHEGVQAFLQKREPVFTGR